jgi:hypothetical protein
MNAHSNRLQKHPRSKETFRINPSDPSHIVSVEREDVGTWGKVERGQYIFRSLGCHVHESKLINLRLYAYITRDLEPATLEREGGQVGKAHVGFLSIAYDTASRDLGSARMTDTYNMSTVGYAVI